MKKENRQFVIRARQPSGVIYAVLLEEDHVSGRIILKKKEVVDGKEPLFLKRSE